MAARFRSQWVKREPIRSWHVCRSDASAHRLRVRGFPSLRPEVLIDMSPPDDELGCFRALARIVHVEMWLAIVMWMSWSILQRLF
jgi:hypothetical protein